jgi:hypothetical protein
MLSNPNRSEMESSTAASKWEEKRGNQASSVAGDYHRVLQAENSLKDSAPVIAQARVVSQRRERTEMLLDVKRAQLNKMEQLSHVRFIRHFISQAYLEDLAKEIRGYEQTLADWQEHSAMNSPRLSLVPGKQQLR